jgi:PAS domain S-box-containing protein
MPGSSLSSRDFANLKSALDEAAIVAITDNRGIITYVNKKFCAISKYSAEELLGKTHKVINSGFHPKEFFAEMWNTIKSGKVWEGEVRNRAKDGSYYWVFTTIVPYMGADGTPESYVSVRYEITDRVMAQEQLKIHTKKLEISNRELQDFASVAAHDLQEPLRKIQSFSERLQTKGKEALPPEMHDYLDRIQNSASRMQILINDLLTYSRVTTKAQPFVQVDLNHIIEQVHSDLEVRLENTKGKIVNSGLPKLEADPTQMRQLFQNLLSNALKFHKTDTPPVVTITSVSADEGDSVEIHISDNGIGFDEKYLDRIFTIFQRLHGRFEYEGTGIGLAVCRKIVDRHGGYITARSAPNNGATFILTLPLKQVQESL